MPTRQKEKIDKGTLALNTTNLGFNEKPEKFKLDEQGFSGLNIFAGVTREESKKELQWPKSIETYKKMTEHVSINACLTLYENLISKVNWRIKPPSKATKADKTKAAFVQECLDDMDASFTQFIKDALSSNVYGFSIIEKVYRRRLKKNGSIYNDGKIGLKKLGHRNQETIQKFIFDEEGNEIIGVKQNLSSIGLGRITTKNLEIILPRSKFIHVTTGRNRGDPFGKSRLRDVYLAWRYLEVIQEIEASGVARDLVGLPVISIPAEYMSADASPDQKIIYENFKNIIRNIQQNSQSGIILPSQVDPETKTKLFSIDLLTQQGQGKNFDINKIKDYYQNQIFMGLFCDVLLLGSNGSGSFALGTIKNSLTGTAVESMLNNIVECFNRDVIRQLYELNGWDTSRCASLDYEGLTDIDLDSYSKFIQRAASVGLVEIDRDTLNSVRKQVGLDPKPEDEPVDMTILTGNSSRASDGMEKGSGNGTSDSAAGTDTSSINLENAS